MISLSFITAGRPRKKVNSFNEQLNDELKFLTGVIAFRRNEIKDRQRSSVNLSSLLPAMQGIFNVNFETNIFLEIYTFNHSEKN